VGNSVVKKRKKKAPPNADEFTRKMMEGKKRKKKPDDDDPLNLALMEFVPWSSEFLDMFPGLDVDERTQRWIIALARLERGGGNKKPLTDLMRAELGPVGYLLADWVERVDFKLKPNRPRLPVYHVSPAVEKLLDACERVRELVLQGRSVPQALEEVAQDTGIDYDTLTLAHGGRHGGMKEAAKRRAPLTKKRRPRP
jgi:hypothetical protein